MHSRPVLIALLGLGLAAAQQIDSGGFERNLAGPLSSRADSDAERQAFDQLSAEHDPHRRRQLAGEFINRYSRSWLLATVYQFAAAASLDVGDYGDALTEGRRSLRIIPENPALLVAMANIEAGLHQTKQARQDASDTLLWLRVFAGPSTEKPADWESTRASLEAAARVILTRTGGAPAAEQPPTGPPLNFAGSESCKPCHAAIYEAWRDTGMSRMLSPIHDSRLLTDFTQGEFRDSSGRVVARFGGGTQPYFEFDRGNGEWKRYPVRFSIGSKWQQAYATELSDGRLFVFPIQYNAVHKRWVNYWSLIDLPGTERDNVAHFPQLSPAFSYQRNCAVCHTSQLRLARLDDKSFEQDAYRETGVNCEMCHGPSAEHVAAMRAGHAEEAGAQVPPFRFSKIDNVEGTLICGQCHRQSALRVLARSGEMNYTHKAPYFDLLLSQPYIELGNRPFYRDGRFRETTYIGEAFLRSACFRRGGAQCASCHDPHAKDAAENPASLKFRSDPDRMCLQCHGEIAARLTAHTHHAASSRGSRCVACHMPPIMNGLMVPAASHQIDDIPDAEMAARFGQKDSPNACLICHADKDTGWLLGQLVSWQR